MIGKFFSIGIRLGILAFIVNLVLRSDKLSEAHIRSLAVKL